MATTVSKSSSTKPGKTPDSERPTKKFRLRTQRLYLTYPKCCLSPEEALAQLKLYLQPSEWIIATEKHKDGSPHLHVYCYRAQIWSITNPRELDLACPNETCEWSQAGQHHGNYQACRSPKAVALYVTKENTWITNLGNERLNDLRLGQSKTTTSSAKKEAYIRAREKARTEGIRAAMEELESENKTARDLCLHGDAIQKNLCRLRIPKRQLKHRLEDFSLTWSWDMEKMLILTGPTGVGKSSLAKAMLPKGMHLLILYTVTFVANTWKTAIHNTKPI